jgi:hypothetical protein
MADRPNADRQDHRPHRGTSYAAIWRHGAGPVCAGKLIIAETRLHLEGADRSGTRRSVDAVAGEIASVRLGRSQAERIDGRLSVVIGLAKGDALMVSCASGLGITHEIADRVGQFVLSPSRLSPLE